MINKYLLNTKHVIKINLVYRCSSEFVTKPNRNELYRTEQKRTDPNANGTHSNGTESYRVLVTSSVRRISVRSQHSVIVCQKCKINGNNLYLFFRTNLLRDLILYVKSSI